MEPASPPLSAVVQKDDEAEDDCLFVQPVISTKVIEGYCGSWPAINKRVHPWKINGWNLIADT